MFQFHNASIIKGYTLRITWKILTTIAGVSGTHVKESIEKFSEVYRCLEHRITLTSGKPDTIKQQIINLI